jgi:phosphatidylglycerophosphate synthase
MQALRTMSHEIMSRRAGAEIVLCAGVLAFLTLLLATVLMALLDLGFDYLLLAAACFAAAVAVVWYLACRSPGLDRFGAANRITLIRVALLALIAASLGEVASDLLCWVIIGMTIIALILDGIDGYVARKGNASSAFGARFDMEVDAALIMVLAVLCWQFGKAGSWILTAGALRYGFVLVACLLPWMRQPLPYSRRRQTVCVLQSAGLLAAISPLFPMPQSAFIGLLTLVILAMSFLVDVLWLWTERQPDQLASGSSVVAE